MSATPADPDPAPAPARLLFVDDEPGILSALKRLFHHQGHTLFTATSGAEGLTILEKEPIDAVISDMRMPGMDGAQFLEEAFKRRPETKRILLTGFADAAETIAAINRGKIWRYIAKPWNEEELIATVNQALTHRNLMAENARLLKENAEQNAALKALNASLEEKVAQRTEELSRALASLESAHNKLHRSFISSVQMFASLTELRGGRLAGHSRRIAALAKQIGEKLGLSDNDLQDVILAALLHDIGEIGLPDALLHAPFNTLAPADKALVMKHPAKGAQVLMGVDQLVKAAKIIRHHHEHFDGSGYPDKASRLSIPLGARILTVADNYDALQQGMLMQHIYQPEEARAYILKERGVHYDPLVVDAFISLFAGGGSKVQINESIVSLGELKPGMVLSRDLLHRDGHLLLEHGRELEADTIARLTEVVKSDHLDLTIYVQPPSAHGRSGKKQDDVEQHATAVPVAELKPGATLAQEVLHNDGFLILSRGMRLDEWATKELQVLARAGKVAADLEVLA